MDWSISNPPYSCLNDVFKKSAEICNKGFGYLLHGHNITLKRIKTMEEEFGLKVSLIHLCEVKEWYGRQTFILFEKNYEENKIDFSASKVSYKSDQKKVKING